MYITRVTITAKVGFTVLQTHTDQTNQHVYTTFLVLWQWQFLYISTPKETHFSILNTNMQLNELEAHILELSQIQFNFSVIFIQ